jgi:uncharacterized protein YfdQ (DUF2303 family)
MPLSDKIIAAQDVAAISALAYQLHESEQTPKKADILNAKPFVILDGHVVYIDETFKAPARKTGTVQYGDARSFILAFEKEREAAEVADEPTDITIYGSMEPAKFTAVFNDHGMGPGYRDHRAEYVLKHSKEWDAWLAHNGSAVPFKGNEDFAYFVENHASDFASPTGGQMLEIALNFSVKSDANYRNVIRLTDGNIDLGYTETVEGATMAGGQKIAIPEKFAINIPIFSGIDQRKFVLDARFRFRIASGKLVIWYDIIEPHKAIEAAFKEILMEIEDGTKGQVLFGVA